MSLLNDIPQLFLTIVLPSIRLPLAELEASWERSFRRGSQDDEAFRFQDELKGPSTPR